jgi:hypothetical protein
MAPEPPANETEFENLLDVDSSGDALSLGDDLAVAGAMDDWTTSRRLIMSLEALTLVIWLICCRTSAEFRSMIFQILILQELVMRRLQPILILDLRYSMFGWQRFQICPWMAYHLLLVLLHHPLLLYSCLHQTSQAKILALSGMPNRPCHLAFYPNHMFLVPVAALHLYIL